MCPMHRNERGGRKKLETIEQRRTLEQCGVGFNAVLMPLSTSIIPSL